jgi:hypothetical protein
MIELAGLVIRSVHGSYGGSAFDVETSDRCIFIAEKP